MTTPAIRPQGRPVRARVAPRSSPARDRRGRHGAASVLAGAFVALAAAPAAAHVLIESVQPNGDGSTTLTFMFDHGCAGEPTDDLHVTLPEGVVALAADQPEGWTAEVGPDAVQWSGTPVPHDVRATFVLDVRVTGEVGQSFVFPTEQGCTGGASYSWTGTDPSSAHPAPSFVATAASLSDRAISGPGAQSLTGTAPLVAGVLLAAAGAGTLGAWEVRRRQGTV